MLGNNHTKNVKSYLAFTLAEVLITLVIIGTIAALTIPSLMMGVQKAQFATKLQKEYSVLQQAFNMIVADSGGSILNNPDFNCSGNCYDTVSANAMNDFAAKINVVKNCGINYGCWYTSSRKYLGGSDNVANLEAYWGAEYGKAALADSSIMMVTIFNTNCASTRGSAGSPLYQSVCGNISIDVNGKTGPNQMGRDYFAFWITKYGMYPYGTYNDGYSCDINSSDTTTSFGCAAKVLTESAMNY